MKILNVGSINVDHVYSVPHFVNPGETIGATGYRVFSGGKGFNQSIALARAGAGVLHAGQIGKDGEWLAEELRRNGVDTTHVALSDEATGHALIQVAPSGENAIVVHGGANQTIAPHDIERAIASCAPGDCLLVQNETNGVAGAILAASARGMRVVLNPAPMNDAIHAYPLDRVDLFILNTTEAHGLTGQSAPDAVGAVMSQRFPRAATILTMGEGGAAYLHAGTLLHQPATAVNAVDTTAAGDTFVGYFLASFLRDGDASRALAAGCRASAVCVTRPGASSSIPHRNEL
ncbi:MAG: ribokinase [Candidatus Sumerlaeota bacterium]|nr:ribokinase [Candidatus Sumerlaeota bacterium]